MWDRSFRADGCAEEVVFTGGLEDARKGRNCLVERVLQIRRQPGSFEVLDRIGRHTMRVDEFLHKVLGCHGDELGTGGGVDGTKQERFRSHYRSVTRRIQVARHQTYSVSIHETC